MTPQLAYERLRNRKNWNVEQRLEAYIVILREPQPINKDQLVAEALSDIAELLVGLNRLLQPRTISIARKEEL